MSFARTKIQPPRPRGGALLARPRVDDALAQALATQRLVLISAAAGYGKTAAMARQIERWPADQALAWVSADAGDDLPRLLECLIAALEPFDLPWRSAPESLIAGSADARGRSRITAELLNALEASDVPHGVIVIDDLHRIDDQACFQFLDGLIERLGQRWTVALLARHDPPLALARWRAAGELAEFRHDALRWRRDELAQWLSASGTAAAGLDALLERTEGWAAGVQLALRAEAGASVGSERALTGFLTSEVIDTLDAELRDFLLDTCVLAELTAARAAAVSGRADAARLLARVEQMGLFVSTLESAEPTLKLHDLLRAALAQRLAIERPQTLPALWQRAAAGEGDPLRRITMLLRAGDTAAAAQVLLDATPAWVTAGALATVRSVLAQFDAGVREELPAWQLARALLCWAQGDFGAMDDAALQAQSRSTSAGDAEGAALALGYRAIALNFLSRQGLRALGVEQIQARSPTPHVVAGVALAWADIDEGHFDAARRRYAGTLAHLERSSQPHLWYQGNLGTVGVHIPGMGPLVERWVDGALRVCGDEPLTLRAMAYVMRGWHKLLVGADVPAARQGLLAAQQELRWQAEPLGVQALAMVLELQIESACGDATAARRAIDRLVTGPSTGQGHRGRWIVANFVAGCAAAFGDAALIREQLDVFESTPVESALPGLHAIVIHIAKGHLAWLNGDAAGAIEHWQRALADEVGLVRTRLDAPLRLFFAAACVAAQRHDAAAAALAGLHTRAVQGAAGSMLLARPVAALLLGWAGRAALDAEDRRALEAWGQRLAASQAGATAPPAKPLPPVWTSATSATAATGPAAAGLSSRETEVLERIAAGDSNKLIARAFDLSPHTVKRHVANILDKLALQSRGQAAAWFRANA